MRRVRPSYIISLRQLMSYYGLRLVSHEFFNCTNTKRKKKNTGKLSWHQTVEENTFRTRQQSRKLSYCFEKKPPTVYYAGFWTLYHGKQNNFYWALILSNHHWSPWELQLTLLILYFYSVKTHETVTSVSTTLFSSLFDFVSRLLHVAWKFFLLDT